MVDRSTGGIGGDPANNARTLVRYSVFSHAVLLLSVPTCATPLLYPRKKSSKLRDIGQRNRPSIMLVQERKLEHCLGQIPAVASYLQKRNPEPLVYPGMLDSILAWSVCLSEYIRVRCPAPVTIVTLAAIGSTGWPEKDSSRPVTQSTAQQTRTRDPLINLKMDGTRVANGRRSARSVGLTEEEKRIGKQERGVGDEMTTDQGRRSRTRHTRCLYNQHWLLPLPSLLL